MIDVRGYFKGDDSIENKEELLFSIIERLDQESYRLFSEIIDLDKESTYKIDSLALRCQELNFLYLAIEDCFNYLNDIEVKGYAYASKRLQSKRLLASVVTINLFMFNFVLAIIAYIMINRKANKEFADEFARISERVFNFDEERLDLIKRTLDNCNRLLEGKMNKLSITIEHDYDGLIAKSNDIIEGYIRGKLGNDYIEKLPPDIQNHIVNILHNDLNVDSKDIYELLGLTKEKFDTGMKLIKDLNN